MILTTILIKYKTAKKGQSNYVKFKKKPDSVKEHLKKVELLTVFVVQIF